MLLTTKGLLGESRVALSFFIGREIGGQTYEQFRIDTHRVGLQALERESQVIGKMMRVQLADGEYGNHLMEKVAREILDSRPEVDYVHVSEHGGWFLEYARQDNTDDNLLIVGTANDMARLSVKAIEFINRFDGWECEGMIRREELVSK